MKTLGNDAPRGAERNIENIGADGASADADNNRIEKRTAAPIIFKGCECQPPAGLPSGHAKWSGADHGIDIALAEDGGFGMREFGIAAAVALAVSPGAIGVAGVYGALLMTTSPMLARALRNRDPVR